MLSLVVPRHSCYVVCISVSVWPTGMPIWGIILALLLTTILQIPIELLLAATNLEFSIAILAIVIGGHVRP